MLIPGFLLALLFLPICHLMATELSITVDLIIYFTMASVLSGWILSLWDMSIYKLFEGRSWPGFLFNWGLKLQKNRLAKWRKNAEKHRRSAKGNEYNARAFRYPINDGRYPAENREPTVMMPTELGNVIYGFETYPNTKYGADGVFYWHRIWHGLDKDMRQEIDEIQSVADGALYIATALLIGSLLFLIYAGIELTGWADIVVAMVWGHELGIAALLLFLAYIFYRRAIACNEAFGERIKAMFDHEINKLPIGPALIMIREKTGESFCGKSLPDKHVAAWRYLRWHMYRAPDTNISVDIESVRTKASGEDESRAAPKFPPEAPHKDAAK